MKAIHTQLFWPTWVDSTLLAKTTKTGENGRENWYITAKWANFARKQDFAPNSTTYILPQAGVKGNRETGFFGKVLPVFLFRSAVRVKTPGRVLILPREENGMCVQYSFPGVSIRIFL